MKNSICFLLLFVFFYSCESFLDRPPLDEISTDAYWRSSSDLDSYMRQFYPTLPTHGTWGAGYGYSVLDADNAISESPNDILNGTRGVTGGRWVGDWSNIRAVNIFFDNYGKCEESFNVYSQYVGEAHFFRAWYYFQLVNTYGDVPWYSSEISADDEELLMKPRDPRTLVVDSIIADLDYATEYLGYRSDVGNNRLNKESALAFKSRVGLFEGTWQKYHAGTPFGTSGANPDKYLQACVDAAEELMNGQDYQKGIYGDYYEMFGLDDMSSVDEIFLFKAYNVSDGMGNDVQNNVSASPNAKGMTWSLITSYLGNDGNPYDYMGLAATTKGSDFLGQAAADVDPRFHATVWAPGDLMAESSGKIFDYPPVSLTGVQGCPTGFWIKKCSNPSSPAAGVPGGGTGETGYIYFRYGEVLLNYAEARYELTGEVATDALNLLRQRVGMPDFTVIPQSSDPNLLDYGYPVSDELYEIRRERRVELAMEGHRGDDYRRWAAHELFKGKRLKGYPFKQDEFPEYNPPLDENGLIDFLQPQLPNGYQFREGQDYLSPIPSEEINLNPDLDQNPGW